MSVEKKTSLNYLSPDEVKQLKDKFRNNVEEKLLSVITDDMSEEYIKAIRQYINAHYLSGRGLSESDLDSIAVRSIGAIKFNTKSLANPLFSKQQRQENLNGAKNKFTKLGRGVLGTNQRRLYFELDPDANKSQTQLKIEELLEQKDYKIINYSKGYATDKFGKQQFKIGKLIKEDAMLLKEFQQDEKARKSNQNKSDQSEYLLVLSDRATDIAYMATRRSWFSCMSFDHNLGYQYQLPADIEHGSLIAYLIKKDDPNIYNPLSRVTIKPYYNDNGDVIYHANNAFGTSDNIFINRVRDIIAEISSNELGIYNISPEIYKDGAPNRYIKVEDDISAEDFLDLLKVEYTKRPDGKIIIPRDLDIAKLGLEKLPDLSNVIVEGKFDCSQNKLKSLAGSPQKVNFFNCENNYLMNLKGGPQEANSYICKNNQLISIEGSPRRTDYFDCSFNQLPSLIGGPEIADKFNCMFNKLICLEGSPRQVNTIYCRENPRLSLYGLPDKFKRIVANNKGSYTNLAMIPADLLVKPRSKLIKANKKYNHPRI